MLNGRLCWFCHHFVYIEAIDQDFVVAAVETALSATFANNNENKWYCSMMTCSLKRKFATLTAHTRTGHTQINESMQLFYMSTALLCTREFNVEKKCEQKQIRLSWMHEMFRGLSDGINHFLKMQFLQVLNILFFLRKSTFRSWAKIFPSLFAKIPRRLSI